MKNLIEHIRALKDVYTASVSVSKSAILACCLSLSISTITHASHCDLTVYSALELHCAITGGNSPSPELCGSLGASPGQTVCISSSGSPYIPMVETDLLDNRTKTFLVTVNNLTLVGDGQHNTVLSGDINSPEVREDNAYHVVVADTSGTNPVINLRLKHLTITQGYADGFPATPTFTYYDRNLLGGALLMIQAQADSTLHLENIKVDTNHALLQGGGVFMGGGCRT